MLSSLDKAYRKLLQLIFRFDKWHVAPLNERPYAIDIVAYCNQRLNRYSFAEIGCGLGDIVRNVNFEKKIGYDLDTKVLKAAKFISYIRNDKEITYAVFEFPAYPLHGTFDTLLMVNWIHHIEPAVLKEKIAEYFDSNLSESGELIIDTVQDKAYKYNHQIDFLSKGLFCSTYRIGEYSRQREVWAIRKRK